MFSLFYFFPVLNAELPIIIASCAFYLGFIMLYWALVVAPANFQQPLILGMHILGLIASGTNPSASMFISYGCFFAGFYLPKKSAVVFCTIAVADLFMAAQMFGLWTPYYLLPGIFPIITLGFMGAFIQQDERHKWKELQNEKEKGQLAKTAERERIARDLHDTLGHTLTSITLKAQLAKKLGEQGHIENALKEISEVEQISRTTLADVREVVNGYKHMSLEKTLRTLQGRLKEAGFTLSFSAIPNTLKPKIEAAITLILMESITNIIRHSNGNAVDITLISANDNLVLNIKDNGRTSGFTPGNGIAGIKERVRELDGTFTIDHQEGVMLKIEIPQAVYSDTPV